MPAATCPAPATYKQTLAQRVVELEWLLDNQPATPAQREAWCAELAMLDAELELFD